MTSVIESKLSRGLPPLSSSSWALHFVWSELAGRIMPLAFPSPAAKRFEEEDVSSPSPATATNSPAFAIDPGLLDSESTSNHGYSQQVRAIIAH